MGIIAITNAYGARESMDVLKVLLTIIAGYLLGSFSMSIALSRETLGADVREKGSGNAGATNMARVYGWRAGFLTLGGDMLKAILAMLLGWWLLGDWGVAIGGIAAITGHCFPVFYHFKGGKGISVGAAIGLAIDWRVFVTIIVVFLIVALLTKKVSAGSLAACIAIAVSAILFQVGLPKIILACYAAALAIFQHRKNIDRLAAGTEPDFQAADDKKK